MAFLLTQVNGFETQGAEEANAISGSVAYDTSIFRNGLASLKITPQATPAYYEIDGNNSNVDLELFAFAVYFTDVTPGATTLFAEIRSSAEANGGLNLHTDGDISWNDNVSTENGKIASGFSVNTWHFLEFAVNGNIGAGSDILILHIDGVEKFNVSTADIATSTGFIRLTGADNTAGNPDIYFDDSYSAEATTASDFLGDFAVKAYQNTAEDATDQGDTLAAGTWANVSETPGNEANEAHYENTGNLTGSTITDEGTRAGPSGDSNITGATIKGAKFISNLMRGTGGGRTHTILHGNSGDGVTATADLGLTTDYIIYEVLSESASIVPLASESFQMGFSKSATAGQDIHCADQWCMLGYIPAAVDDNTDLEWAGTQSLGQQQPVRAKNEIVSY